MLSEERFYQLSQGLLDLTEQYTLTILNDVRDFGIGTAQGQRIPLNQVQNQIQTRWEEYVQEALQWVDNNLPEAYLEGLREADIDGVNPNRPILGTPFFGATFADVISKQAQHALRKFSEHLTMYGVFQEQAYQALRSTIIPVVRDTMDVIRDIDILTTDRAYRT